MSTKQETIKAVTDHPSGKVKLAITDIDGVLRGKYISTRKFLSAVESHTSFCDVIFGWDSADTAYEKLAYTGWHTGYPDSPARLDLSTFRSIPWEGDIPFFLAELTDKQQQPSAVDPRQLLKKIAGVAGEMGYTVNASQEFEWYNFLETPQTLHSKNFRQLTPLTPGMFGYSHLRTSYNSDFFTDLFDLLGKFGIPVEGIHTETGPGTYEAAIEYSGLVEAGDRAVLFKTAVKEIAYRHGIIASFMAKINESLPGCGGHVHQSLSDKKGNNVFFDGKAEHSMSETMQQYVAGQLYCLPYVLPMYAPTINSYKRLVEGAWAPTTLTWGLDNRTVALRILAASPASARIENRVIGADANPYLAMAASVASGLYGIRNKLSLGQPRSVGNGYLDFSNGQLPHTLEQAAANMKSSPIAAELFGEEFTAHFTGTREWEWKQHLKAVTDWELRRYLEII
ncbi:MAG: glutamine synthetase [Chitinophagaceae bacterium]|nr:MAG: glutamine synthetase [Chitinophagaceae bacterium]